MDLRAALDIASDLHSDDWVKVPGGTFGRPATAILAAMFDPGVADDPRTRALTGHSLIVYAPDPRLSIVWPVPEDDDYLGAPRDAVMPDWAEEDDHNWKHARGGWAVIFLGGAPVWQEFLWYLDWGVRGRWVCCGFRARLG